MLHHLKDKADAQIPHDVLQELHLEAHVDEAEVGIQVGQGVVTLTGIVGSYAKNLAAEAAHRIVTVACVREQERQVEPIFNFLGQKVGCLEGEIAFSGDGRPVAFVHEGPVFAAKNGNYLGHFHEGVFRDRLGCIVAFVWGTQWFTTLMTAPDARPVPRVQSHALPENSAMPAGPSHRAEPLLNKSSLDWERFVLDCEAQWPWKTRC